MWWTLASSGPYTQHSKFVAELSLHFSVNPSGPRSEHDSMSTQSRNYPPMSPKSPGSVHSRSHSMASSTSSRLTSATPADLNVARTQYEELKGYLANYLAKGK
ncbi:hypothetical protein BC938DRAFT_474464 [Jimgerdemannia flammicorona]|uniref:Uncharacterized protein n=1 Tax=Jimgerdemannia flammicorona TaxID=994334 RepID=A0A433Q2C5_9FUNG|nr:hypothetical protein BC938DRAFT_474464 [Jimgerdemannia flammicorona]